MIYSRALASRVVKLTLLLAYFMRIVASAQTPPPLPSTGNAQLDGRLAASREAYSAFKKGELAVGLAKLEGSIDRDSRAPHPDLQFGRNLGAISSMFYNENNPKRARELALQAIARLDSPRSRMTAGDAGSAFLLSGQLYDYVVGDRAKAKAAYEQGLLVQPQARWAAERLQHLIATERAAAEKVQANILLQQRANGGKR
jgi:tetratricopeptide (TPR) repeat protein